MRIYPRLKGCRRLLPIKYDNKLRQTESLLRTDSDIDRHLMSNDNRDGKSRNKKPAVKNHDVIMPVPFEDFSLEKSCDSENFNDVSIEDNMNGSKSANSPNKNLAPPKQQKKKYKSFVEGLKESDMRSPNTLKMPTWVAPESHTERSSRSNNILNHTLKGITKLRREMGSLNKSTDYNIKNRLKFSKPANTGNNGNINININIHSDEFRKARAGLEYKTIGKNSSAIVSKSKLDNIKMETDPRSQHTSIDKKSSKRDRDDKQVSMLEKLKKNVRGIRDKSAWMKDY